MAPASWILISYQSQRDRKQGAGGEAWIPAHNLQGEAASPTRMPGSPTLDEEARQEDKWIESGFGVGDEASRGSLSQDGGSEACLMISYELLLPPKEGC